MSLRKTESQVKDLLTETILTLCRNTLNQYADVSVEGLLGVTLDKQEIFLVSINQQIENKRSEESDEAEDSVNGFNVSVSRKRANNSDGEHCSSYSNSGENTDNENNEGSRKTVRKRRRRRRSGGSNGEESCPSIQGPGFESLTFPEIQKASFLSNQSNFNVDSVDDQDDLEDELNDPAMVLRRLAEATRKINEGGSPVRIKQEVTEDDDECLENGESALVIKEEKNPEECWPSSSENNVHSTPSVFPVREKSTSDHDASLGHLSDVSGDHSMSEQGPGPSASASHSGSGRRRNGVGQSGLARRDLLAKLQIGAERTDRSDCDRGMKLEVFTGSENFPASLPSSALPFGSPGALLLAPGLRSIPCSQNVEHLEALNVFESPDKSAQETSQTGFTDSSSDTSPVIPQMLNVVGGGIFPGLNNLNLQNTVRALFGDNNLLAKGLKTERPASFPCEVCGKFFQSTSHVRRHMLVHTGEKPFACPVCGMKFGQKATMKKHMKNIHDLTEDGLAAAI